MQTNPINREIVGEICRAFVLLGAENDLLGTVGSWGDSLPESIVLADLQAWNDATLKELRDRISQIQTSCPLPSDIQTGDQKMARSAP
jgi:hypothetical protein